MAAAPVTVAGDRRQPCGKYEIGCATNRTDLIGPAASKEAGSRAHGCSFFGLPIALPDLAIVRRGAIREEAHPAVRAEAFTAQDEGGTVWPVHLDGMEGIVVNGLGFAP